MAVTNSGELTPSALPWPSPELAQAGDRHKLSPQQREPQDGGGNRALLLAAPITCVRDLPASPLRDFFLGEADETCFPHLKILAYSGLQKWHFEVLLSP